MKIRMLVIGLVLCSVMVGRADTNVVATLPAIPAVAAQTVELQVKVSSVECMFLRPALTNMQVIVRFDVLKPDGSLLRYDALRITQAQIAASGDPAIPMAMASMGAKVNVIVATYVESVKTNANWLAGKRVDMTPPRVSVQMPPKK